MKETKIYVANLAKYNNGEHFGFWFTLPVNPDEVMSKLRLDEGSSEFGEEYAIHDVENPYNLPIGEYSSIEEANQEVEQIQDLPGYILDKLDLILGNYSLEDVIECQNDIELIDAFSEEELAHEIIDSIGSLEDAVGKDDLENYFDYAKYGRDLVATDYIDLGGVYMRAL